MDMMNESCSRFLAELASKAPTPGGGGYRGTGGCRRCGTGQHGGCLTVGKKKYAAVEADLLTLNERPVPCAQSWKHWCRRMPKPLRRWPPPMACPRTLRSRRLTRPLCWKPHWILPVPCRWRSWASAPKALHLWKNMPPRAARWPCPMQAAPPHCARPPWQAASLNVFINTKLMTDKTHAAALDAQADALLSEYVPKADAVFAQVTKQLRT